ncbi:hypothetical protein SAMN04487969_11529 [Paenibacillus algorifonticola]|uniref:Uncharacterized protein n=1 Tax=Paenibacillus algorifonticola TaxID=684063 RepID=A0A1I2G8P8_9BACL|nr:hypothetical protein [Paenibacillus algorifonticola]SFF13902.1 hypothetical protein SAMN04487969_11529 [Paenibacillus algorifonticola]
MELFDEIHSASVHFSSGKPLLRPKMERISNKIRATDVSLLGLFIISPSVMKDRKTVVSIPLQYDSEYEEILNYEIIPHFENTLLAKYPDFQEYVLMNLRESSGILFRKMAGNHEIITSVGTLYETDSKQTAIENHHAFNVKEYLVKLDFIHPIFSDEFNKIWTFLSKTYLLYQEAYVLLPDNWAFNELFKERLLIKQLASVCKEMRVTVNTDNNQIASISVC